MGAVLVGVIAELPSPSLSHLPARVVALTGVESAGEAIAEGAYIILDPERGKALVEPDPKAIALYQQVNKPRVLLGPEHDPARTLSGVYVPVWRKFERSQNSRSRFKTEPTVCSVGGARLANTL